MPLLLSLALAATPDAPPSQQVADSRCLALTASAVGQATDDKIKVSLMSGMFYFIGKVKARDPDYGLEKEMRRSYAELAGKPALTNSEQARCSAEVAKLGGEMIIAGKALQTTP